MGGWRKGRGRVSEVVREGGRVEERGEREGGSNHLYSYDIGGGHLATLRAICISQESSLPPK